MEVQLFFWKKDINFQLRGVSHLYIDGDVIENDGFIWRFTGFYGEPRTDQKNLSWKALHALNASRKHPWRCMGDFNEILLSCEKMEGSLGHTVEWKNSGDALEECSLTDLGFIGDTFTWRNNSHSKESYIRERLDRAVADNDGE